MAKRSGGAVYIECVDFSGWTFSDPETLTKQEFTV